LDIERDILSLPYIHEVMVVGVADEEYGQRVAAAVSLRTDQAKRGLHIDELRKDLRGLLTGYKLPTLLRVVDGELPKNVSGKVVKKVLGQQLFPKNYHTVPEVQMWKRREVALL
jgi:malonyl-CoA/methylmalonyl-CoA synthetase